MVGLEYSQWLSVIVQFYRPLCSLQWFFFSFEFMRTFWLQVSDLIHWLFFPPLWGRTALERIKLLSHPLKPWARPKDQSRYKWEKGIIAAIICSKLCYDTACITVHPGPCVLWSHGVTVKMSDNNKVVTPDFRAPVCLFGDEKWASWVS